MVTLTVDRYIANEPGRRRAVINSNTQRLYGCRIEILIHARLEGLAGAHKPRDQLDAFSPFLKDRAAYSTRVHSVPCCIPTGYVIQMFG